MDNATAEAIGIYVEDLVSKALARFEAKLDALAINRDAALDAIKTQAACEVADFKLVVQAELLDATRRAHDTEMAARDALARVPPAPEIDAETLAIDLAKNDTFLEAIRKGVPAPEKGADGEPGRDRPTFVVLPELDGVARKNTFLAFKGGLWQAVTRTSKTPEENPAAWVCLVSGVAKTALVAVDDRNFELVVERSDGEDRTPLYFPLAIHRGLHEHGREYEPGDEVLKGDCTFRAMSRTKDAPPGPAWQMVAKSKAGRKGDPGKDGKDGKDGGLGPRGYRGAGIKDAMAIGNRLTLITDDDDHLSVQFDTDADTDNGGTEHGA